uniref:Centriolar and ciliogenesis-associated protein HYLS1 C-terminal domain-containing protein n=1 Tax=Phlebotomus kandelakii TaxID=1109342 RepID=A0A6B2EJE0_9DIPT
MSISLDAREVLHHLNELGYKNITAQQLKEFIRDLKKLIKYDTLHCKICKSTKCSCAQKHRQKLLYREPTLSFLAKIHHPEIKEDIQSENIPPSRTEFVSLRSKMWIRPKVTRQKTKSDPVALHSKYQQEWSKFKNNIPGQNKHLDLRWSIRERLSRDQEPGRR